MEIKTLFNICDVVVRKGDYHPLTISEIVLKENGFIGYRVSEHKNSHPFLLEEKELISAEEAFPVENEHEELESVLGLLDVPQKRRKDLKWLSTYLAIRNWDNPNFPKAMFLIKRILSRR